MNFDEAIAAAINTIESYKKELKADDVVFCYTDSEGENFRKWIYADYKGNRQKLLDTRPMGLNKLKHYLAKEYKAEQWAALEADDVMGILATDKKYKPNYEKIIVSEDKDMKTIPCLLYNPRKDTEEQIITEADANEFLAMQCLAGDAVDGYSGCPSIGMVTAEKLIRARTVYIPTLHEFKTGKRKGESEIRWEKEEGLANDYWPTIKSVYAKNGLTAEDALMNCQCARILRTEDYKNGKIKLWNPSKGGF